MGLLKRAGWILSGLVFGLFAYSLIIGTILFVNRVSDRTPTTDSFSLDQIEEIVESSVKVRTYFQGMPVGIGSGVIIKSEDSVTKILTAEHVVHGSEFVTVALDRSVYEYFVVVESRGVADHRDYALLSAPFRIGKACNLVKERDSFFRRGQCVLAIGFALGSHLDNVTVTTGEFQAHEDGFYRHSAPIIFGNSGGGLFALVRGKPVLIGLNVRVGIVRTGAVPHMAWATSIWTIRYLGVLHEIEKEES